MRNKKINGPSSLEREGFEKKSVERLIRLLTATHRKMNYVTQEKVLNSCWDLRALSRVARKFFGVYPNRKVRDIGNVCQ